MIMTDKQAFFDFLLHLGDNAHILGHRLGEWCGHGPVLEQDIAMTNISLDLIGQARNYLDYAGALEGKGRDENALAYRRDALDYKNFLLLEQPNGDFAQTIARQFYFDTWHLLALRQLAESKDERLRDIALKSVKEVTYHQRWSSEWVIRLGDGTEESHDKMQHAINDLWMYTGELFEQSEAEKLMLEEGLIHNASALWQLWDGEVERTLLEATLEKPADEWMQSGGKTGYHSEHLGYILAEMQFLQRAYPDATW